MTKIEEKKGSFPTPVPQQAPYQGNLGKTQIEKTHYRCECGHISSIPVVKGINVNTDRTLAEKALSGELNKIKCVACNKEYKFNIPYILHHPLEERLVLVIPEELRWKTLELIADTYKQIAADVENEVPLYVEELTVVIGLNELKKSLSRPPKHKIIYELWKKREKEIEEKLAEIKKKEIQIEQEKNNLEKEKNQSKKKEGILTQESNQLHKLAQDIKNQDEDLKKKEQKIIKLEEDLKNKQEELEEKERALHLQYETVKEHKTQLKEKEKLLKQKEIEYDKKLKEINQKELLLKERENSLNKLSQNNIKKDTKKIKPQPDYSEIDDNKLFDDFEEEIKQSSSTFEDVEEVEDVEEDVEEEKKHKPQEIIFEGPWSDIVTRETPIINKAATEEILRHDKHDKKEYSDIDSTIKIKKDEIANKLEDPALLNMLTGRKAKSNIFIESEKILLYALIDKKDHNYWKNLSEKDVDLKIQLHQLPTYPLVTLQLNKKNNEDPKHAIFWILNIEDKTHKKALDILRKKFSATIILFNEITKDQVNEFSIYAEREINVVEIISKAQNYLNSITKNRASLFEAELKFFDDWDRLGSTKEPIADFENRKIDSIDDIIKLVKLIELWNTFEKRDYILMVRSVPTSVWDEIIRVCLKDVVSFGYLLNSDLRKRAVAVGVAQDENELILQTMKNSVDHLEDWKKVNIELVYSNFKNLKDEAEKIKVVIPDRFGDAWNYLAKKLEDIEKKELEKIGDVKSINMPELLKLLKHNKRSFDAAKELINREKTKYINEIFKSIEIMDLDDGIEIMLILYHEFKEEIANELMEALECPSLQVRYISALMLEEMKIKRSIIPLCNVLFKEQSELWIELGRILGKFGISGLRPFLRLAKLNLTKEERINYTLASFAYYGVDLSSTEEITKDSKIKPFITSAKKLIKDIANTEKIWQMDNPPDKEDSTFYISYKFKKALKEQ